MHKAIAAVKPGMRYRDVGDIISQHAQTNGLSVVKSYCGHGIGDLFHCAPNVPHYSHNKAVGVMRPGHVFTIEVLLERRQCLVYSILPWLATKSRSRCFHRDMPSREEFPACWGKT